jgi:hypothetical protein
MGWTYAFLNSCELKSFHESYSSGVLPDNLSKLQLYRRREVNERLCLEEVGVDLELCVHAHGPGVWLIMELLVTIIILFVWIDLVSMFCYFATVVSTMIVLLWSHFLDKFKHLSSADQCTCPTSILIYLRVLPPGISRISCLCTTS